jgi:DNA invertase Pin-like site-specific DNA recombinase
MSKTTPPDKPSAHGYFRFSTSEQADGAPLSKKRRAYSYIRFSTVKQADGGSLDRQVRLSAAYCQRKKIHLDESLTLTDLGRSAFRSDHVREGPLAGFLEACRTGRVPKGSSLIVESLDRLSRDQIRPALQLFLQLQDHGITIVTLQPEREYPPDGTDALSLIEPLIVFARAHEESAMKSHRRADGWKQARDKARAGGGPMLKTCPAWLEVTEDGFREKPEAVDAVRKIFDLARTGLGVHRIVDRLIKDKVLPIGKKGKWVKAYVHRILTQPAAKGTYQPNKQKGKSAVPDGDPIPDYYPAIVTEAEWDEAQAALQSRGGDFDANGKFRRGGAGVRGAGRKGKGEPNLFTGLVWCALTRQKMHLVHACGRKGKGPRKRYVYLMQTRETGVSRGERIDSHVFEKAILSELAELRPADIVDGKPGNGRKEEFTRLSGRLLDIDNRLERARQRARTEEDFDAFLDLIKGLNDERKLVVERRAELEHEEDGHAAADLGEAQSLIGLLAKTPAGQLEEIRRRLRVRIGQLVTAIWVVIVRQGKKCICAVQVYFRGGDRHRDYIILHVPGNRYTKGQPPDWRTLPPGAAAGKLDLRRRLHARQLEAKLAAVDLEKLR